LLGATRVVGIAYYGHRTETVKLLCMVDSLLEDGAVVLM
jgi:hypothetical protein